MNAPENILVNCRQNNFLIYVYLSTNSTRIFQVFSSLTVNIARPQCFQFINLVIQPISTVVTIIVVPNILGGSFIYYVNTTSGFFDPFPTIY